MRAAVMLALVAGCGFEVTASGTGGSGDGGVDTSASDAGPDASGPLPACMTSSMYANGPEAGHRYRRIAPRDRDSAVDACTADGAHLAVIETAAEDAYVHSLESANIWIGLDDLDTEGIFRWVNGTAMGYEHFEGQEPNDNGTEDCVTVNGDGTWNDTNCGDSIAAICECEASFQPRPTPVCRGMAGFTSNGRKYILRKGGSSKNWNAAKTECEQIGAYLPVFADRDEEGPVNQQFAGDNWIGLSDISVEGKFEWIDGSTPPQATIHWNLISPHSGDTNRNCVRIFNDWEDKSCTEVKEYSCECEP